MTNYCPQEDMQPLIYKPLAVAEKYLNITGCKAGTRHSANTSTFIARIGTNIFSPSFSLFQYLFISSRILPAFGTVMDHVLYRSSALDLPCSPFAAAIFLIFSYCHIAAELNEKAVKPIVNISGRFNVPHDTGISSGFPSCGTSFCLTKGPDLGFDDC